MALSSSDLPALAAWDAIETCDRIRRKDVSAHEVLEAAIARAEEARHLGAVFENTFERARAGVANLDSGAPLLGVPTFIKDMTQIQGVPMTWGTRAAGRYVSRRNDPIVTSIDRPRRRWRRVNPHSSRVLRPGRTETLALSSRHEGLEPAGRQRRLRWGRHPNSP